MMQDPTVHSLDKDLSAHVADCAQWRQQVLGKLGDLRNAILIAAGLATTVTGALFCALGYVAWAFIRRELHLP